MEPNGKIFLITGGGGYLGSVLTPILLGRGYGVRVLDRFFWGTESLAAHKKNKNLTLIEADTRSFPPEYFKGVHTVVDLAALSNDPIGELRPQVTLDINYHARVRTAAAAKQTGVQKYILASSCSVYGYQEGLLEETAAPAPVTTYARASVYAENKVLPLSDKNFSVTVLRQGTLFGVSPRMRFDLVLNTMALSLFRDHRVVVHDGEQWRPLMHVEDAAAAFVHVAEAEHRAVAGEIFNVGATEENYQMKDLAEIVAETVGPAVPIVTENTQSDFRSYRVSFEKIKTYIGYATTKTARDGAREVYDALKKGTISETLQTKTVRWYKHLLSENPDVLNVKTDI